MNHTLETEIDTTLAMWEIASDAAWIAFEDNDIEAERYWDERIRIWRKIYFTLMSL